MLIPQRLISDLDRSLLISLQNLLLPRRQTLAANLWRRQMVDASPGDQDTPTTTAAGVGAEHVCLVCFLHHRRHVFTYTGTHTSPKLVLGFV